MGWFRQIAMLVSANYRFAGSALGVAGVFAALADLIAIFIVEARAPAPFALRLGVVAALDVTMVMPVVVRRVDDRESNEADGDAHE